MKQLAWLNAKIDGEELTRSEKAREEGSAPPMPDNPLPHVASWLLEAGPDKGDGPLDWLDIKAWQELSGLELLPFEAALIRRMSIIYSNQKFRAAKPDCPMPFNLDRDRVEARRDAVAAKIAALFG